MLTQLPIRHITKGADMKFRIVMDSAGELTDDLKGKEEYTTVPFTIRLGEESDMREDCMSVAGRIQGRVRGGGGRPLLRNHYFRQSFRFFPGGDSRNEHVLRGSSGREDSYI